MKPKLRINKQYQEKILVLKQIAENNRKREDEIFDAIAEEMKLSPSENEILWDHIYNGSDWMVELEQ